MAGKKNKNNKKNKSNKKKSNIEARPEAITVASDDLQDQAFKDLSSPDAPLKRIAITNLDGVILWEDIQRVFPNVHHLKNGDADVPFATNKTLGNLIPLRILRVKGVVLGVVPKASSGTDPVDIPMPALENLSLEIRAVKKPFRRGPPGRDQDTRTDAERLEREEKALITVKSLAPFFGTVVNALEGPALEALTILAYSDNPEFQEFAALQFPAEIVKGGDSVKQEVMDPILYLLQSDKMAIHDPSLYAIAKLLYRNEKNCKLAVELGVLEDLNRWIRDDSPEIHWIALVSVEELTQIESLTTRVAKSGVIDMLFPLALSKDDRVPRLVAIIFANLSCTSETRQMIVKAGAIPVLMGFLDSLHPDVLLGSAQALTEIVADNSYRGMVPDAHERLASILVGFISMDPSKPRIAPSAASSLCKLFFDEGFIISKTIQDRALLSISQMMRSDSDELILSSLECFLALARGRSLASTGTAARLIDRAVELISYSGNATIQYYAVFVLYGLAYDEPNARIIVEAGAANCVCALVLKAVSKVQTEMVKFLCHLTSFESLHPQLHRAGMVKTLIPFSLSPKEEVWYASAGAILQVIGYMNTPPTAEIWNAGLHDCFARSLCSNSGTHQVVAIRVILEWIQDGDLAMKKLIASSTAIMARVKEMATTLEACAPVPVENRRDTTGFDPCTVTMAKAIMIVEILELPKEE